MAVTRRMASKAGGVEKIEQTAIKASKKNISNGIKRPTDSKGWSGYKEKIRSNIEESWSLLTNPTRCSWWPFPIFLLVVETIVNVLIIQNVNYTEIDWKAYMQVRQFLPIGYCSLVFFLTHFFHLCIEIFYTFRRCHQLRY